MVEFSIVYNGCFLKECIVDFKIEICFIFIMYLEWIIKINGEGIEVF